MKLLGVKDRHTLTVCSAIQRPCRATQQPEPWGKDKNEKEEMQETQHNDNLRSKRWKRKRNKRGCRLAEGFLLFTNIFISSLFTETWLMVVCFSSAISSCSSSSSNGFVPTGSVLVATFRLITWSTIRYGLTCTHTYIFEMWTKTMSNFSLNNSAWKEKVDKTLFTGLGWIIGVWCFDLCLG